MNKSVRNIIDSNLERLATIAIFAIMFSVLGYFIPILYLRYFDKTEYVKIHQPVSSELLEYKRGDNLGLILNRKIVLDTIVKQNAKIVHVNGNTITTQLSHDDSPPEIYLSDTKGEFEVTKTNTLFVPCNAVPGRNYIQVFFTYNIKNVEKTYSYISEVFTVLDEDSERCK